MRNGSPQFYLVLLTLALVIGSHPATAQATNITTVTVDEAGNGTVIFPGDIPRTLDYMLQPDPGPGGLSNPLTYYLPDVAFPGLTAGDLLITDPNTSLSDVIRFNPLERELPINAFHAIYGAMVFYSLAGGGLLADTGLPTDLYANRFTLVENQFGPTIYTPLEGQPGFVAGANPVTYIIYSDEAAGSVPDYANTGLLMIVSLTALFLLRRTPFMAVNKS